MTEEEARAEVARKLGSQAFRLSNLYWIEDENGKKVKFRPRWEQKELHNNLHDLNAVLKCRQPGISTYCAILALDFALFCPNKTCGIIDKTDDDAKRKLAKMDFAYTNLDARPDPTNPQGEDTSAIGAMIKQAVVMVTNNKKELEWSNGSKVWAGTGMRGGTLQLLWISELGYTSFYNPTQAEEIKKGALNTVHKGNRVIIETTHEGGKFGVWYGLVKSAMEAKVPLGPMDWKFHFFPWWRNVNYTLPVRVDEPLTKEDEEYFARLAERGIALTAEQKRWYVKKRQTIGDSMFSEFPSVEEECFEAVIKGAIYGRIISQLRAAKRICDFEHDRNAPLYAFWDLGYSDYTAIWLIQMVGRDICALAFRCNCREAPPYYVAIIREWERKYEMPITMHYLPHDADAKEKSGKSYRDYLREAGVANTRVVIRSPDIWFGINHLRSKLPQFYFHKTNCGTTWQNEGRTMPSGIGCLEGYHTKEDGSTGVIKETPVHDDTSHGSDSLRTWAEAHQGGLLEGTSIVARDGMTKSQTILAGWNASREMMKRRQSRTFLA
jgi:hypothetical protein